MDRDPHYNEEYFAGQKFNGAFAAQADFFKFEGFTTSDEQVIDFGCGGGFMLARLNARERIGVDINEVALHYAQSLGIRTAASLEEIDDS